MKESYSQISGFDALILEQVFHLLWQKFLLDVLSHNRVKWISKLVRNACIYECLKLVHGLVLVIENVCWDVDDLQHCAFLAIYHELTFLYLDVLALLYLLFFAQFLLFIYRLDFENELDELTFWSLNYVQNAEWLLLLLTLGLIGRERGAVLGVSIQNLGFKEFWEGGVYVVWGCTFFEKLWANTMLSAIIFYWWLELINIWFKLVKKLLINKVNFDLVL